MLWHRATAGCRCLVDSKLGQLFCVDGRAQDQSHPLMPGGVTTDLTAPSAPSRPPGPLSFHGSCSPGSSSSWSLAWSSRCPLGCGQRIPRSSGAESLFGDLEFPRRKEVTLPICQMDKGRSAWWGHFLGAAQEVSRQAAGAPWLPPVQPTPSPRARPLQVWAASSWLPPPSSSAP